MRTIGLFLLCLAACHSGEDPLPKKAVPVVEPEPPPPEAPVETGPTATLRDLDGGPAAAPKSVPGVLLCAIHSVWQPPADFTATAIHGAVVARRGQELVAIVFPPHADDAYARATGTFVDGEVAWDAPAIKRIDDWHAESTAHGHASGLVVATRTLYAGVDPKTGKGRASGNWRTPGEDTMWLAVAPTEARADELLADAKEHTKMLVDHACECGDDCYRRR